MRDYNVNKKCNICGISFPSNRNYYRTDGVSACRQCGSYFLKADEKDFLKCFGINEKYVFDISGMKQKEWQSNMWIANKFIGSGSRPCRKNGHTIKLLSGHCPQCRTDSLGFTLNYFEKKFVYLALSESTELIKIGISTNPKVREHQLNTTKYAGLNDWKIVETKFVEKAGKAETKIHRALSDYRVFHKYFRDGQFVQSSETFESKFDIAFKAFRESCEDDIVGRNGPTHEII